MKKINKFYVEIDYTTLKKKDIIENFKKQVKDEKIINQVYDFLLDVCNQNELFYTNDEKNEIIKTIDGLDNTQKLVLLKKQINNPTINIFLLNDSYDNIEPKLKSDSELDFSHYGSFSNDMKKYMNKLYGYDSLNDETKRELLLLKCRRIRYHYTHTLDFNIEYIARWIDQMRYY